MTTPVAAPPAHTAESLRFLAAWVHRESGIALDQDKNYLLEARLLPITEELQLESLDALCAALRNDRSPALKKKIVEAMTTHETFFFRDASFFDALRNDVLPQLIGRRQTSRTLHVWSAATSSGQEAYSLAMLLLEMGLDNWHVRVLGTDLSEQILLKAREGLYAQMEVNRGLPARCLVRYFDRCGIDWRVRDSVRRMVTFEPFDLRHSARGKGPFDVILCRNVLIYFDVATRKKIVQELRGVLSADGYLVLGSTESIMHLESDFKPVAGSGIALYQVS